MEVSIRDLKSRLSEYLRRVAEGEEMIVTSHGKEVARLVPPRVRRRTRGEVEAIEQFRNLPWVRAGNGLKIPLPKPLVKLQNGEKTLADIVSEQRG